MDNEELTVLYYHTYWFFLYVKEEIIEIYFATYSSSGQLFGLPRRPPFLT